MIQKIEDKTGNHSDLKFKKDNFLIYLNLIQYNLLNEAEYYAENFGFEKVFVFLGEITK
jgi:hypothetical protein